MDKRLVKPTLELVAELTTLARNLNTRLATGEVEVPTLPEAPAPPETPEEPEVPTPPVDTTPRFSTKGPHILAPDGSKFVPIGANVGVRMVPWNPPTYAYTAQGYTATGHVQDALDWGWNLIRVNVDTSPPAAVGFPATVAGVQDAIDEYTAKGIVVMPASHSMTGKNWPTDHDEYVQAQKFWEAILRRNPDNPYLWVNYVNEPFTKSAPMEQWLDTGNELYRRTRELTDSMFVYEVPGWSQQLDWLVTEEQWGQRFLEGKSNVVLAWHNYGAMGTAEYMTETAQKAVDAGLPVIVTEFGYDWRGDRHNSSGVEDEKTGGLWTFDNAGTFGFGAVYWHGTNTSKYDEIHCLRHGGKGAWYSHSVAQLSDAGHRLLALGTTPPSFPRP